ncbi:MAG: PilZ domain-containing protein [Thiobacillaceae bacterium]
MITHERRRYPRFPFHSKGQLSCSDMTYGGTLIDISLFGALFHAKFARDELPGTRCTLLVLNLNDSFLLKVEGVIAHVKRDQVGIEFASIDEERQKKIRHITLLNLAPPHFAERDLPALLKSKSTKPRLSR